MNLLHDNEFYINLMERQVKDLEKVLLHKRGGLRYIHQSTEEHLTSLLNFEIPEDFNDQEFTDDTFYTVSGKLLDSLQNLSKGDYMVDFRVLYIYMGSYAIITKKWLNSVKKLLRGKTVLEVMCGSGMLTKGLRDIGINVIATDYNNEDDEYYTLTCRKWIDDIETIDAEEAVKKYANNIDYIIISWPPYENEIDYKILQAMRRYCKKDCFILYIGELGDSCGSNRFYAECNELKQVSMLLNKDFHSHKYMHDKVHVLF